jgi:hypothetical protein
MTTGTERTVENADSFIQSARDNNTIHFVGLDARNITFDHRYTSHTAYMARTDTGRRFDLGLYSQGIEDAEREARERALIKASKTGGRVIVGIEILSKKYSIFSVETPSPSS